MRDDDLLLLGAIGGAWYLWDHQKQTTPSPEPDRKSGQHVQVPWFSGMLIDLKAAATLAPSIASGLKPAVMQTAPALGSALEKTSEPLQKAAKEAGDALYKAGGELFGPLARAFSDLGKGISSPSVTSVFTSIPIAGALVGFAMALVGLFLSWGGPPPPNVSPKEVFYGLMQVPTSELWVIVNHFLTWPRLAGFDERYAEDFLLHVPTADDQTRKAIQTYRDKWVVWRDGLFTIRSGLYVFGRYGAGQWKDLPPIVDRKQTYRLDEWVQFAIVPPAAIVDFSPWKMASKAILGATVEEIEAAVRMELCLRRANDWWTFAMPDPKRKIIPDDLTPDEKALWHDGLKRGGAALQRLLDGRLTVKGERLPSHLDRPTKAPHFSSLASTGFGYGDPPAEEYLDLRQGLLWATIHRLNREAAYAEGRGL